MNYMDELVEIGYKKPVDTGLLHNILDSVVIECRDISNKSNKSNQSNQSISNTFILGGKDVKSAVLFFKQLKNNLKSIDDEKLSQLLGVTVVTWRRWCEYADNSLDVRTTKDNKLRLSVLSNFLFNKIYTDDNPNSPIPLGDRGVDGSASHVTGGVDGVASHVTGGVDGGEIGGGMEDGEQKEDVEMLEETHTYTDTHTHTHTY
eukprot:GHVR01030226.1.p2 GENE.GHVR01030226.1~~GHVR01030226.1.p2  ORF type:complete len:204 (-),score=79.92 GHVR01030226.1:790-1401(-)